MPIPDAAARSGTAGGKIRNHAHRDPDSVFNAAGYSRSSTGIRRSSGARPGAGPGFGPGRCAIRGNSRREDRRDFRDFSPRPHGRGRLRISGRAGFHRPPLARTDAGELRLQSQGRRDHRARNGSRRFAGPGLVSRARRPGKVCQVALLSDLSPAACHLSYNYTHPVAPDLVKRAFATILAEVKDKIEALYSTDHFEPACDLYTLSRPEVAARLGDTSQMLMSRSSSEPGEWQLVGKEAVEQYLGCRHPNDREAGAPNASSLECDWIRIPAILSYVVWSDVYRCEGFKTVEEPTDRT